MSKFPDYAEMIGAFRKKDSEKTEVISAGDTTTINDITPEEQIEIGY